MELKVVAFLDEKNTCLDGDGNPVSFVYPCAGFKEDPESAESISTVEIYLAAEKYGGKVLDYKVDASDNLLAAITEFSNHHDGKETGLDCYGFVNLIGGKPNHAYRDCVQHWQREDVSLHDIQPGDIVCFGNSDGFFAHAAICIESDVFLSVYGIDCDIQFAPFAEMQKHYDLKPEAMRLT